MTVSSTKNRSGPYNGNGIAKSFPYEFRILDPSHLQVVRTVDGKDSIIDAMSYTVSGVGNDAGTITFAVAPASGQKITVLRDAPFTQQTDLENQGAYFAEVIERALDLAAMRDQQLAERLSRALLLPAGAYSVEAAAALTQLAELLTGAGDVIAFSSIWQGSFNSDPLKRKDGTGLHFGDLYFNQTENEVRVWGFTGWTGLSGARDAVDLANAGDSDDGVPILHVVDENSYRVRRLRAMVGVHLEIGDDYIGISADGSGGGGGSPTDGGYRAMGYIIPEDFGAKGDGVADDTMAVQSALDSGSPVFFPARKYLTTGVTCSGRTTINGVYGRSLLIGGLTYNEKDFPWIVDVPGVTQETPTSKYFSCQNLMFQSVGTGPRYHLHERSEVHHQLQSGELEVFRAAWAPDHIRC